VYFGDGGGASCSRMLYVEFTVSQSMGSLRCMERALGFFGGTTANSIFDNRLQRAMPLVTVSCYFVLQSSVMTFGSPPLDWRNATRAGLTSRSARDARVSQTANTNEDLVDESSR
jgi:hypothetical protein